MRSTDPARNRTRTQERIRNFLHDFDAVAGTTLSVDPEVVLAAAADPALAALGLLRVSEAARDASINVGELIDTHPGFLDRLIVLAGASEACVDHVVRWPNLLPTLAAEPDFVTSPDSTPDAIATMFDRALTPDPTNPILTGEEAQTAIRKTYRDCVVRLATQDLTHPNPTELISDVTRILSDLAAGAIHAAYRVATAEQGDNLVSALAIVAMGKCGARELNYVSDVDVVFAYARSKDISAEVVDDQVRTQATAVATRVTELISGSAPEPALWELDAALRPEGKAGPLVRTVPEFERYYRKVAHNWEFQALLKARPIAGDEHVREDFARTILPFVWTAGTRTGFVTEVRAMRKRVISLIPHKELGRHIKLGPGGLRDVEFSAQILQLVHGAHDDALHTRSTLSALSALGAHTYISSADAQQLSESYRFMRTVEHRLQIPRLSREAVLPERPDKLRVLARTVYRTGERSVDRLTRELATHNRTVRALHEQIFYRPILDAATAHVTALGDAAARERLSAFGYKDPASAMKHIRALSTGINRVANVQRQVLPALLNWFSQGVDPDAGLVAFRRLSEGLSTTSWYLPMLRDSGVAAQNMAHVLSLSQFATELLISHPESVQWLSNNTKLDAPTDMAARMRDSSARHGDNGVAAIRQVYGTEVLRTSLADVLGLCDMRAIMRRLTTAMDTAIDQALLTVRKRLDASTGIDDYQFAVIGMGRFGGGEIGYFSDADAMFVYTPGASLSAGQRERLPAHVRDVALSLTAELAAPAADPIVDIDADLRPEGKTGPLVRTLASYEKYYSTWSEPWEAQALLRARPVAGDTHLQEQFVDLINPLRYPTEVPESSIVQMRRLKARMEKERLPRGADPKRHLKLGTGSLSDVEWSVQMLQLMHAHTRPELATTGTLEALDAAQAADLIDRDSAHKLEEAWTIASRVRSAITLYKGRSADKLPASEVELEAIARLLGYQQGSGNQLVDDYLGRTRRARKVMEQVFYGYTDN